MVGGRKKEAIQRVYEEIIIRQGKASAFSDYKLDLAKLVQTAPSNNK